MQGSWCAGLRKRGEFVYLYLEVFSPWEGFQADVFRLPELPLFVPCTFDYFLSQMSFGKKRNNLSKE